jgi:hypothetical protein
LSKNSLIEQFALELADEVLRIHHKYAEVDSIKDEYVKDLNRYYQPIFRSIESLRHINTYLSLDSIPSQLCADAHDELEYFRYHIENFHIRCVSILDYSAILINHCLKLGIPFRKCNPHSVSENTTWKNSLPVTLLKKFDEEFKEIKTDRNKIIHRGEFENDSLEALGSLIWDYPAINDIKNDANWYKDELDQDKYWTQLIQLHGKKEVLKNTLKIFNAQIKRIEYYIEEIVKSIMPYFECKGDFILFK